MKYLLLLLIPFYSFSQSEAPKNATTIIVKTSANLDSIELILFKRGFTVDTRNNNIGVIITKPRELKGMVQGSVIARILLKDSIATITGDFTTGIEMGFGGAITTNVKDDFSSVSNRGSKKSAMKNSWYAIENIAKQLGNNLEYR